MSKIQVVCRCMRNGKWFHFRTNRHDITEILLKVALNTIKQTSNTSEPHQLFPYWAEPHHAISEWLLFNTQWTIFFSNLSESELVNNKKKQAKEKFHANLNDNLSDLKTVNSKLYYTTINMLLKSERPTNDVPPLRNPNDIVTSNLSYEGVEKCDIK